MDLASPSAVLVVGAAEEFLELQLADARDQMEAGRKALQEMGVAAELIDKGGRMLEKVIEGSQQKAFQSYQAALAYFWYRRISSRLKRRWALLSGSTR